ncbi:MAG: hypothetical protein K6G92_13990 [Bacteroidaceae bacterium]|nr:hypothetical protein [Bacteroidaceae bacterium]
MKRLLLILYSSFFILHSSFSPARAQNPDSLTFAVLGNSISTYYDYIPSGYAIYYTADREKTYGIQVGDTWWMQLSRLSGLTFLANASWSGSRVSCDLLNSKAPFLSNERVKALGRAGKPDFIFIAGGTNDWNQSKVPLGEYRTKNFTDSVTFRGAYQRLLFKLTTWYPQARVVCLGIFPRGNGVNDKNSQGWSQADANASIKYIAEQFGQYYIDCTNVPWSNDWAAYTLDRLHPSAAGATLLAQHITNAMLSQGIITRDLKRSNEVEEAERLLDISFTADGIVNQGTYAAKVGKHGTATTFYDAARDTYYGCSKARASDYYYATYDEGSPLVKAFNSSVTWEMLVRLDALADQNGNISRTCILGNEENGGWAFYNSELASSFCYQNKSGVKSSMKSITGDSILLSGKFYHLVATMDRMSHIMRYFINGKLVCTSTRAGSDMTMPQCGTTKGRKGMWICLGGDATSGSVNNGAEGSSACSFVFARIYDGALSQKAATALYNDDVKRFTEPQTPYGTELLMDCEFTPDGAVNHAPSFGDRPIVMMDTVQMRYNADINHYEAQFNDIRSEFFKYQLGDDPAIMSQLTDAYSVEVFCRSSEALPTTSIRPLSFVNGYGFGLQMNNRGNIGYTTTTQGNKADGTFAKTQWSWIGAGNLTADYTHYVIVYDRKNYRSQFYVNGELADTRWLTFKECPVYEWAPTTWLSIGGDAVGTYEQTSSVGSYSFMGDVALVRVYGNALSKNQVQSLAGILSTQEMTYTLGTNGYAAVCLPYIWQVPEDCTAYIITEIASPSAMLTAIAATGDYVPYGTPVLLSGPAKAQVTLTAQNKDEVSEMVNDSWSNGSWQNLLVGTYPGKTLDAGEGYYMRTTGTSIYRATTPVALPPFSCYLPSAEKRSLFKLEEAETGIESIQNSKLKIQNDDAVYDLTGRKIVNSKSSNSKLPKGLYIQNGKKIFVRSND